MGDWMAWSWNFKTIKKAMEHSHPGWMALLIY
jgi:hypothetical protein